MPVGDTALKKARLPSGLPPYLASLYEVPLLTRAQEAHLFRKMNYLKFKATKLREKLEPARPKSGVMDQIENDYDEAVATKNQIIRANLRLVVSRSPSGTWAPPRTFLSWSATGNMSLMRAVEKFDYARGKQVQHLRQLGDHEELRPARFPTSIAIATGSAPAMPRCSPRPRDDRSDQFEQESAQMQRESQVEKILSCPRRPRAADHRPPLRPATGPGTVDAQGSGGPNWG